MAKREIRPIRVEGQVAYVPLTQGYTAIIDAADVQLVEGCSWSAMEKRKADGTIRTVYAKNSGTKRGTVFMHRLIAGGAAGAEVDHIDSDGLNNRRANIRSATTSQNQFNQRLHHDSTSGFKGVSWIPSRGKWQAQIQANGKRLRIGYFRCATAAAIAYAKASRDLHGEFGRVA